MEIKYVEEESEKQLGETRNAIILKRKQNWGRYRLKMLVSFNVDYTGNPSLLNTAFLIFSKFLMLYNFHTENAFQIH